MVYGEKKWLQVATTRSEINAHIQFVDQGRYRIRGIRRELVKKRLKNKHAIDLIVSRKTFQPWLLRI
jgi:uncharacterized protein (UPF0262 family)